MTHTEPELNFNTCSVADIALHFPGAIRVLNRYGLDYSCNGKRLFLHACEKAYVDSVKVWNEIMNEVSFSGGNRRRSFKNWETTLLIDFILQHHHEYLRVTVPQIMELLNTVCEVHSDQEHLQGIRDSFGVLSDELMRHLPREEQVLFPALRKLTSHSAHQEHEALVEAIHETISVMEHEHSRTGELIRHIRDLSGGYAVPLSACPTFHLLFKLLEEFEYDVMQHIHLENNILFPKVKTLQH